MPEIAELAGVQRPVVTMWRRRHPESFPRQAGGDATRPLFNAGEVADWLLTTGRTNRSDIHAEVHKHTLAHLSNSVGATDLLTYGSALICLRMLDDEPLVGPESLVERARRVDPDDRMLLHEIDSPPPDAADLAAAMDDLVEAAWGCRPAFKLLIERTGATLFRDAVVPELGRLIASVCGAGELAASQGAVRIVDPWAGSGDLVTALLDEIGEDGTPLVNASTSDKNLTRLMRRRLALWDVRAEDQQVVTQDATRLRRGQWDVLVTRTPYRAAEHRRPETDLTVLRDLSTCLQSGQCAVVLAPADLLSDRLAPGPAAIRADVLRTSAVEAIVSLPAGLMPYRPGYRASMWVLRHDESGNATGRALLADVSDRTLTSALVADLQQEITTWRREGYRPAFGLRMLAHAVTIDELVNGTASLSHPRRPDLTEAVRLGPARVASLIDLEARLAQQTGREEQPLRSGAVARDPTVRPTVSIGVLIADGRLVRVSGTRLKAEHTVRSGHHRVIGVPEIVGSHVRAVDEVRPADRRIDRKTLAQLYAHAPLTEPGDVVVTLTPRPAAIVDEAGFSVVEFPAATLRGNRDRTALTPRTLAALISAAPLVTRGARLDQLHLPVLDDAEVAALDELLERLEQRRSRAQDEIDTLDALRRTTLAGLADGTLTISAQTG